MSKPKRKYVLCRIDKNAGDNYGIIMGAGIPASGDSREPKQVVITVRLPEEMVISGGVISHKDIAKYLDQMRAEKDADVTTSD